MCCNCLVSKGQYIRRKNRDIIWENSFSHVVSTNYCVIGQKCKVGDWAWLMQKSEFCAWVSWEVWNALARTNMFLKVLATLRKINKCLFVLWSLPSYFAWNTEFFFRPLMKPSCWLNPLFSSNTVQQSSMIWKEMKRLRSVCVGLKTWSPNSVYLLHISPIRTGSQNCLVL